MEGLCHSSALCCSRIPQRPDCSTPTIRYMSLASWKKLASFFFLVDSKFCLKKYIYHRRAHFTPQSCSAVCQTFTLGRISAAAARLISTVFSSQKNDSRRPLKVRRYQHAWRQIKMFTRLVRHSRLCQGGPATVCKCITLCVSPPGSKLD